MRYISFLLNCEHTKNKYAQVPEGLPMSTERLCWRRKRIESKRERERESGERDIFDSY